MRVIGTAGHVDHGKSTLVAALTGIHPDRLKEEQEREMTIDLGFAWMGLPGGETVGIVDVPGHRDFIENMLAGVGGIDAVLFVVAADEGVMPQTREHLLILDVLQVEGGVIALTKCDLVDDDWLDLVKADVRQTVQGTVLADAPIFPVSARSGTGLAELVRGLEACLAQRPARPDLGRPRLPVDRVFTMPGFGTVVTGTLMDGRLRLGEDVELLPSGVRGRIRGLQTHKKKEQSAVPGSRTAVNISGVDVDQVRRGDVLVHPGKYRASTLIDVYFKLVAGASAPVLHSSEVKLFLGSAEVLARVRLLGKDAIGPGEEGWLQLELREPVVAVRGDRYILRRPSPAETLGGGVVVDVLSPRRHKRFDAVVLERLESLRGGAPAEVLAEAFHALGIVTVREAVARARLGSEQEAEALAALELVFLDAAPAAAGSTSGAEGGLAALPEDWLAFTAQAVHELEVFHAANPLRRGMPREELKSRLRMNGAVFQAALRCWVRQGDLEEAGTLVMRQGFALRLSAQQRQAADRLLQRFAAAPYATPAVKECQAELGEDLYQALLDLGELEQVSSEVVFRREDMAGMLAQIREHFASEPTLTVAQLRDRWSTSRKYVLGFLEYLDGLGITAREGDYRKLRSV